MNPFGKNGGPSNDVPVSKWDLSFQNNLTCNFGALVPVCLIPTLERDKFDISCTFGLRFMPTVFPIQTRIKASIDFFYVRNRNLWSGWMDWYTKMDDSLVFPYIAPSIIRNKSMFSTGSLGDYLGLPTVVHNNNISIENPSSGPAAYGLMKGSSAALFSSSDLPHTFSLKKNQTGTYSVSNTITGIPSGQLSPVAIATNSIILPHQPGAVVSLTLPVRNFGLASEDLGLYFLSIQNTNMDSEPSLPSDATAYLMHPTIQTRTIRTSFALLNSNSVFTSYFNIDAIVKYTPMSSTHGILDDGLLTVDYFIPNDLPAEVLGSPNWVLSFGVAQTYRETDTSEVASQFEFYISNDNLKTSISGSYIEAIDAPMGLMQLPWDPSVSRCNVLPFRAYEQIYNSFYRDERNNPYVLDGKKVYNKFLPTTAGGPDNTPYKLHYRNWEQDFLTTAVPTPQQGVAPLVGISSTGKASFVASEDGSRYDVEAVTGDDHDTITGFNMTENLPSSVSRALVNVATSGISINDFRNVNAFQRWLETNIRKGYKYKDVLKSHFDVDIAYNVLDMPEYLGSVHCDVKPQTVTQTTESASDPLGSYAGQLYGVGGSNNHIRKFCDENGYIVGILSVVPVPNYSQLMNKEWFRGTDPFDFYWPEFANIGLQPVLTKEVAPLQLGNESADVSDFNTRIFGYQRAWYDYLQRTDEVHGLFRTQLDNFVMNRSFLNTPVLGPDFTVVDPTQLNEVFSVTDIGDKILGQVYFDINALRPIPRFGVPRLE
ncbi:major capsid protein [Dipodfec virus UOA04_Rod_462]|nr:major capsid protein [Dipodfec virus UOA04_Rod_462]